MNLEQLLQNWVDTFFAGLKQQYAHRPLILLVINQMQSQLDAQIPNLLKQEIPVVFSSLKALIDAFFLNLENDTKSLPFLAGLLESLNSWLDAEVDKLAQQVTSEALRTARLAQPVARTS